MESKWTDGAPFVAAQRQVCRAEMVRHKPARFVKAEGVLSADWHPSLDGVVTDLQCGRKWWRSMHRAQAEWLHRQEITDRKCCITNRKYIPGEGADYRYPGDGEQGKLRCLILIATA
ncbi:MAG: hypothetical protein CMJ70_13690 [Planctomycetaceae bacterium]|nr:hypothetical protein [Planctomycetaceae bacterium]